MRLHDHSAHNSNINHSQVLVHGVHVAHMHLVQVAALPSRKQQHATTKLRKQLDHIHQNAIQVHMQVHNAERSAVSVTLNAASSHFDAPLGHLEHHLAACVSTLDLLVCLSHLRQREHLQKQTAQHHC